MSQRTDVLHMLKRARKEGVTNGRFAEAGVLRYSARIEELRREGHLIVKQRVSAACWRYTLLPDVERPIDLPSPLSRAEGLITPQQVDGSLNVEPESLFEVEVPGPRSPYDYEEAA